jgi:hypothetical protein
MESAQLSFVYGEVMPQAFKAIEAKEKSSSSFESIQALVPEWLLGLVCSRRAEIYSS